MIDALLLFAKKSENLPMVIINCKENANDL